MNFAAGSRPRFAIPLHPPEQVRSRDIEMSRLLPVRISPDFGCAKKKESFLLAPLPSGNDLGAQPPIDRQRTGRSTTVGEMRP